MTKHTDMKKYEHNKRTLVCRFCNKGCNKGCNYDGTKPPQELYAEALAHEAICPNNPYTTRISAADAEISSLRGEIRSLSVPWLSGSAPEIPKGSQQPMWVTIRVHANGRLLVIPLIYMNAHVMPLSDQCGDAPACATPHNPEPDGCCEEYEWTGWFNGYCEQCECDWQFDDTYTEIVAYTPAPEAYTQEQ